MRGVPRWALGRLPRAFDQENDIGLVADVFADYWAAFSWRLPINQDPPPKENPEPESAGEAVDGGVSTADGDPDTDLTTEEKAQKAKVLTETEGIKRWFSYRHAPGGTGSAANPFAKWLRQLQVDERQPKRLQDWQVYMQDEEKNDLVNASFQDLYPEHIARDLLAKESEDMKEAFKKSRRRIPGGDRNLQVKAGRIRRRGSVHQRRLNGGGASTNDRDGSAFVGRLRAQTGYHITLLAGTVEDGKFDVRSAHSGTTKAVDGAKGKDFTRWDPAGYRDHIMNQFMRTSSSQRARVRPARTRTRTAPAAPVPHPHPPQPPHRSRTATASSTLPLPSSVSGDAPAARGRATSAGLTGGEQEARISELRCYSGYERMRQTNIAQNKEKLAELGLVKEVRGIFEEFKAAAQGTKRKRGDDDDFNDDEEDDEEMGGRSGKQRRRHPMQRNGGA
ncbi:hypothetical protein B0H13DRAFT_1914180, partial [Mycena leptocephala]